MKSILDPAVNRSSPARGALLAAMVLTAATLVPLSVLTLSAQQSGTGATTIMGTVTDPSGAVVPRATMTLTNDDSGWQQVTTANPVGAYSFSGISAGHYTVEAQVPGFAKFRQAGIAVVSGGTVEADVRLAVGRVSQVITVAGQRGVKADVVRAEPAGAKPIRVGGNVQAARLIRQVKPVYPADLLQQGVQGSVILNAVISKQGTPLQLSVANAGMDPALVNAATDAVNQWRWQPTLLNGEPVEVLTTIQVDFTLK